MEVHAAAILMVPPPTRWCYNVMGVVAEEAPGELRYHVQSGWRPFNDFIRVHGLVLIVNEHSMRDNKGVQTP